MVDKLNISPEDIFRMARSIARQSRAERICVGAYFYLGYVLVGFPIEECKKYDYWVAFKDGKPSYKAATNRALMRGLEDEKEKREREAKEEAAGEAAVLRARVRAFAVEVRGAVKILDGALTDLHNAALQMKEVSAADDNEMEEAWQAASSQVMAAAATVDALDKVTRTRLRNVMCANQ